MRLMTGFEENLAKSYPISDVALLAALLSRPKDTSYLVLVLSHRCI